jgi:arginine-tRNA-protein transferase
MKHHFDQRPAFFFVTQPMPCPYLPGRVERRIVTELSGAGATEFHDTLSRAGFRRSHGLVYAPSCPGCRACLAVRTVVDEFRPSASQRRILRANRDLTASVKAPRATAEQYELFATYQRSRHFDGDMASMDFYDYQALVEETPVESSVVELRDRAGKLISACLVDHMSDGVSAVYSFFDPDESRRSPGTHLVLWLIEQSKAKGLPYVYLGYWIGGSPKMSYKSKFRPLEYYGNGSWHPFAESVTPADADG